MEAGGEDGSSCTGLLVRVCASASLAMRISCARAGRTGQAALQVRVEALEQELDVELAQAHHLRGTTRDGWWE